MIRTPGLEGRAVGDVPRFGVEQRCRGAPVPDDIRPVGIGLVVGVARQAGGQLEEPAVGDGVLLVPARLIVPDLPVQAAIAGALVPARDLGVEDGLREGQPGRLAVDFGVVDLGGRHGSQAPEDLVIVSLQTTINQILSTRRIDRRGRHTRYLE